MSSAHSEDNEASENIDEGTLIRTKERPDDMHKRKIDMVDEIYVINVDGHSSPSTRSEIRYAKVSRKNDTLFERNRG